MLFMIINIEIFRLLGMKDLCNIFSKYFKHILNDYNSYEMYNKLSLNVLFKISYTL